MCLKLVELLVEVGSGEPLTERVEDVIGGLARPRAAGGVRCGISLPSNRVGTSGPVLANGGGSSIVTSAAPSTAPVRNPIDNRCPLTDAPHAHHESQSCRRQIWDSVRVSDHARVARHYAPQSRTR